MIMCIFLGIQKTDLLRPPKKSYNFLSPHTTLPLLFIQKTQFLLTYPKKFKHLIVKRKFIKVKLNMKSL